jgi:uncharacterized RDD family membrane protein YckC
VLAAAMDHALLLGLDIVVVYFTLRMAALETSEWTVLPLAPLATFLALIKLAYFVAFTAVGGQTIGKMAAGIRVIADDVMLDPARAIRRTLAGAISMLTLGAGFAPALFGERRALHDRLSATRVVSADLRG